MSYGNKKTKILAWGLPLLAIILFFIVVLWRSRSDTEAGPVTVPRTEESSVKTETKPDPKGTNRAVPRASVRIKSEILVRVIDDQKKPIEGAKVLRLASRIPPDPAKPQSYVPSEDGSLTSNIPGLVLGNRHTSAEGTILLTVNLSDPRNIPKQVQVSAYASGYAKSTVGSRKILKVPPEGQRYTVVLMLSKGRQLSGRIHNLESPADRTKLSFRIQTIDEGQRPRWSRLIRIDEDGTFRLAGAPAEDLQAVVKHYFGKYQPYNARIPLGVSEISIALIRVATYQEKPLLKVHVQAPSGVSRLNHRVVIYSMDEKKIVKRIGNQYRFTDRSVRLPPGPYTVYALSLATESPESYWAREVVSLPDNSEIEVSLKLRKGNVVYFRLTDPSTGRVPKGSGISISVMTQFDTRSDVSVAQFVYRADHADMYIGGLEPGASFVRIADESGVYKSQDITSGTIAPSAAPQRITLLRKP